jgi:hypothetical protein
MPSAGSGGGRYAPADGESPRPDAEVPLLKKLLLLLVLVGLGALVAWKVREA